jgi:rare lipoprotein A
MKNIINPSKVIVLLTLIISGCSNITQVKNTRYNSINTFNNKGIQSPYECEYNQNSKGNGSFYKTDGPLEIPYNLISLEPTPIYEPLNKGTSRPYTILDQNFTPLLKLGNYKQIGVGTWYGRRYHGKKTANGETYDMFQMTAASPILPIPSYAKVTNLNNGRSVTVRINDRGPFLKGRIIDLSFMAACRLGYASKGSANVEVVSILP